MSKLYTKTITLPNGKRKYIRATTKEELERRYTQLRMEMHAGVDVSDTSTVAQFTQLWYNTYRKPGLREISQENMLRIVNNHIIPQIGSMQIKDVKPIHIRRLMSELDGKGSSLRSKVLQYLRSIFAAAEENGLIAKSPVSAQLEAGGKPAAKKHPLTTQQCRALLAATQGTRIHTAVALMLGAGLRREEAVGLMWSDIDFKAGTITVNRAMAFFSGKGQMTEDLKSAAAHRTIPVPDWCLELLREAKHGTNSLYVVSRKNGDCMTESSFRRAWDVIGARTTDDPGLLGKPVDPRHPGVKYTLDFHVHPHLLRHTCITRWIAAGLDVKEVQYLAGHATPEMTLRVYAHYLKEERFNATVAKIRIDDSLKLEQPESSPAV
jgi:integrase